eukprot:11956424-Alexandrium_andersonii.AAC.1
MRLHAEVVSLSWSRKMTESKAVSTNCLASWMLPRKRASAGFSFLSDSDHLAANELATRPKSLTM